MDPDPESSGHPIQRLRAAFSINYASLGLITYLLDRVAELEAALGHAETPRHTIATAHRNARAGGGARAGGADRLAIG